LTLKAEISIETVSYIRVVSLGFVLPGSVTQGDTLMGLHPNQTMQTPL